MNIVTYEDVLNNKELQVYVEAGNELLGVLGYTDHSKAHTVKVGSTAANILKVLNYSKREQELAKIAGYMHDIGNAINRKNHALTGSMMAFYILDKMGMPAEEIAVCIAAIGNHDEDLGIPVSGVSAALIIADKTDVRRSRVRNKDFATFDIHDRVNYSVTSCEVEINDENSEITLDLKIDTEICSVVDYFEIFLTRMLMVNRACDFLKTKFHFIVNGQKLM